MKASYASRSMLMFLISLLMLGLLTLFESLFVGVSPGVERWISLLLLVLPSALGVVFGALSLNRKERRAWIAIAGILLNAFFALFNILVLSFAG